MATASTTTPMGDVLYVFSYLKKTSGSSVSVPLAKLGVKRPMYAYDWRNRTGTVLQPQDSLAMAFDSGWSCFVLMPVTSSGIALLGDLEKITPMEDLASMCSRRAVENEPTVKAMTGFVSNLHFDPATHIFTIDVSAAPDNQAVLSVQARKR